MMEPSKAKLDSAQLRLLNQAIEAMPDAPVQYLLRGEEWLVHEQWERARADFEQAIALTERLLAESAWGYIYQGYIDRANAGLRHLGSDLLKEQYG
ncbi:MAG TPA: hypothetical protein VHP83_01450 [Aggregatilineaceae bacterium]|nr:hypothetical protein [Aggregatilineaceae bacterium]